MKVWVGFGSEHSANLRMIGHFETPERAESAKRQLEELCDLVVEHYDYDRFHENPMAWYLNEKLVENLQALGLYNFSPEDLESLSADHTVRREGDELRISTDESTVSGFLRFLIDSPARVEVYSAHHFPSDKSTGP